ncbi:hypothetical protein [Lysobacter gummosus]|uniref:hypothetical protein n=1 Tax=Lysobacter gummosus TaxID=262324 RepID=UPI00362B6A25
MKPWRPCALATDPARRPRLKLASPRGGATLEAANHPPGKMLRSAYRKPAPILEFPCRPEPPPESRPARLRARSPETCFTRNPAV